MDARICYVPNGWWVTETNSRDRAGYGLCQWEKAVHSNAPSHWLSPYPEWPRTVEYIPYRIASAIFRFRNLISGGWYQKKNIPPKLICESHEISFSYNLFRSCYCFQILHRARQWYCCSLWKIQSNWITEMNSTSHARGGATNLYI